MSIEIGELVIHTEVVDIASRQPGSAFYFPAAGWTRIEEAEVIDGIVNRVVELLQNQRRERL